MMSDAFLTFEIDNLYNFQFKYTFVCIYSVYSLALNRHVEREKHKNFRSHCLVYVLLAGKITQVSIVYGTMYCQKPFIL